MAHYQLSYGFNSTENTTESVNNTSNNSIETKTVEIQNKINQPDCGSSISIEKTESEKRKLPPQPSEPSKNKFTFVYVLPI